jgi:hypothetical protein
MMKVVRIVILPFWALAVGLAIFTTETVADELGWTAAVRAFVKSGPSAMLEAGYDATIIALFWFLTGALAVSWGDWLFRRWEASKRVQNWQHFTVDWQGGRSIINKLHGVDAITILNGTVMGSIHDSDPKLSRNAIALIVQFDCEIQDPCPFVFADRKIIWREVKAGAHYLVLEIDLRSKDDVAFGVAVRPLAWCGGSRFEAPMRWHDAAQMTREQVLDQIRPERLSPRWLPSIAARMLPRNRPG